MLDARLGELAATETYFLWPRGHAGKLFHGGLLGAVCSRALTYRLPSGKTAGREHLQPLQPDDASAGRDSGGTSQSPCERCGPMFEFAGLGLNSSSKSRS